MTWKQLLASGRVKKHATSKQEVDALREVVAGDLADAGLPNLSDDRRFATAYNAALQLAKIVIACAGYRVTGQGHHQTSFEATEIAMGSSVSALAGYFDTCRRKRNSVEYDVANIISKTEADELLKEATRFSNQVAAWVARVHPNLR